MESVQQGSSPQADHDSVQIDRYFQTARRHHMERMSEPAISGYRAVLTLCPEHGDSLNSLALLLRQGGRDDDAIRLFRRAICSGPDNAKFPNNLGNALVANGELDDAFGCFRRAMALDPGLAQIAGNLGSSWLDQGHLARASACYERAIAIDPGFSAGFRFLLLCACYGDDFTLSSYAEVHRRFGAAFHIAAVSPRQFANKNRLPRKLRIGYLGSDFRHHPVGRSLLPVVQHHDRQKFEYHIFSEVARPDAVTDQFRAAVDGWQDIAGMSDAQVAERIRADGIDVLVYLAGHFDGNRPQVAAHRAAPVQISFHDVATSGLSQMDYIIGDPMLLPLHHAEYFAERLLRLPQFYLGELPADLPPVDQIGGFGPAIFGCFNNPSKITPTALRLWGAILGAFPGSRLVLRYMDRYRSREARGRIVETLAQVGVPVDRVEFGMEKVGTDHAFMENYSRIDVALDTLPFSGSLTTFQALAMGVPVVTLPGDRMVSRWTATMLQGMGMPEMVAGSAEDYVAIAIQTAEQRSVWRQRRGAIRRQLAESPLCDAAGRARQLERLYKAAWRRWSERAMAG